MKTVLMILFVIILTSTFGQARQSDAILFDGIYKTKCVIEEDDDEGSQSYLRFYPDGQVISVYTDCEGTVDEIADWFHINAGQVSKGKYEFSGNTIRFSTTGPTGTVHYKGKVANDEVRLTWKSSINGERGRDNYTFTQLNGLK